MNAPRHEMILASAGSGKTYALTNRFVQLLALGARPERIIALTFTRKAAGEFFDEILNKLARAAREPAFVADLARHVGLPALSSAQCGRLLRQVIDAMPQLTLGTFDSFFARIVRSFPLELGLSGEFELLQEHTARLARQRALRHLFSETGRGPDEARRDFAEAFKRATFGNEEKQLGGLLDAFIDSHLSAFFAAPDPVAWGNPDRIWPQGSPWPAPSDLPAAIAGLRSVLQRRDGLPDKVRERLEQLLEELATWSPGSPIPKPAETPLKNAFAIWHDLQCGAATWTVAARKLALAPDECAALRRLLCALGGADLTRQLEITRGIHAVLTAYEAVYHELVRRSGRLTFADVVRLLNGVDLRHAPDPDGTADAAAAERRLLLDWRLDAQFDHWLLDEFQDTSPAQWAVLRNLIDEVVQDTSARRTFFYVGDVKQAIYGWREGDARLFREIFDYYNRAAAASGAPPAIHERRLDQSFRSAPPVLEMVNRVFGNAPALAELFPDAAARRWSEEWREHTSARPELSGHATWLLAPEDGDDDIPARFELTRRLLQEVRPAARGLTAAVLVRRNEVANQLAEYLRQAGRIPAIAESDLHVCTDNPLTAALLALFRAAAHPGDSLAAGHLAMTPLQAILAREQLAAPDGLARQVLGQVHRDGFERTIEWWWARLEPALAPDDAFSRNRGRQMAEAARAYDETGGRNIAEFLQFMERHVVRDVESADVVRVMTIHKSKGLGFDVVILPDLEGQRLAQRRGELAVHRRPDRTVDWVLRLPVQMIHRCDEVLAAHVADEEADACYDQLALLYVGMTRAKRGLYVITEPVGKSQSQNFPQMLGATLGQDATPLSLGASLSASAVFSTGDPAWYAGERRTADDASAPEQPIPPLAVPAETRRRRLVARTPSDARAGTLPATVFLGGPGAGRGNLGREVHALFAQVQWWDPAAAGRWLADRRAAGAGSEALELVQACLEAEALADVFRARAGGRDLVWRERPFEIVLEDNVWVTGVFDRVLVRRDDAGTVTAVEVYDFKTDRVGTDRQSWAATAERHAEQLRYYRQAAAALAQVPAERVRCAVVLTAALDADGRRPAPIELP